MDALTPSVDACDADYKKLSTKIKTKYKEFEKTVSKKLMDGLTDQLTDSFQETRERMKGVSVKEMNEMTDVVVEQLLRKTLVDKASVNNTSFFHTFIT